VKIANLVPEVENKAPFDLYALNRITESSGCYCLTNATGDILYAGQAKSIRQRLIQHFDSSKRTDLTSYGRVSIAWWRVEAEPKLSWLERGWLEWIRLKDGELPPLNRVSAPL